MVVDIAAIYFGLFWGIFPFTAAKAVQQTCKILRRARNLRHHAYLYMIWVELLVNIIFNLASYLHLIGVIQANLGFFIGITVLWVLQTQLLSQIIANRVTLIMMNKRKAKWMKIGLIPLIGAVNITVAAFWNPAQLPGATPRQVELMKIIERAEKVFFLALDMGLNLTFLYLVRFRLIAFGLSKYRKLFNFNIAAICLSTIMDALFVGMLSLPSPYLYVQFAPVAYIVKLHVELTMASLIAKVVQSSGGNNSNLSNDQNSSTTEPKGRGLMNCSTTFADLRINGGSSAVIPDARSSDAGSDIYLFSVSSGIMKTVTTSVTVAEADIDRQSTGLQAREQEHSGTLRPKAIP
ncbi:hypothetical protein MHUMG1_10596 [Metarhizium humberi]|uniref:Integral membrane protein n=1 Tax=Metarhizium humberi TaxID=2596975 RepID=A0A9P8M161_9HYPO|nr:hypothetical protein MHUMG1_10596 [Metarhizium humberi]